MQSTSSLSLSGVSFSNKLFENIQLFGALHAVNIVAPA